MRNFLVLGFIAIWGGATFTSCGFLGDDSGQKAGLGSALRPACILRLEKLSNFLRENIETDIRCLEESVGAFNRYLKKESPDYTTLGEIKHLVQRFYAKAEAKVTKGVELFLEFNDFLFGGAGERLLNDHLSLLFQIVVEFNRSAVDIFKIVDTAKRGEGDIDTMAEELAVHIEKLQSRIIPILEENTQPENVIDHGLLLKSLYQDVLQRDNSEEKVEDLMALKKIFLGGEDDALIVEEIIQFVRDANEVIPNVFSFYFTEKREEEALELENDGTDSQQNLSLLMNSFYEHDNDEEIFNREQLHRIIDRLVSNDAKASLYKDLARRVAGGAGEFREGISREVYTFGDIKTIITLIGVHSRINLFHRNARFSLPYQVNSEDRIEEREVFVKRSKDLLQAIEGDLNQMPKESSVNVRSLLDFFHDESLNGSLENSNQLLHLAKPFKSIVLGDEDSYTYDNLWKKLSPKMTVLSRLYFDILYVRNSKKVDQDAYIDIIEGWENVLDQNDPKRTLFTTQELVYLGDIMIDKNYFSMIAPTIREVKKRVIGGDEDHYNTRDFLKLTSLGREFFSEVRFMENEYDNNVDEIRNLSAIDSFSLNSEYYYAHGMLDYRGKFEHIVRDYRFFSDDKGHAFYGPTYRRSKKGFIEISSINWCFSHLAKGFGHREGGRYVWNLKEIEYVLEVFNPVLAIFDLETSDPTETAHSALSLADLFQVQSDGNLVVDADEATELASIILRGIRVTGELRKHLENRCQKIMINAEAAYSPDCVRSNFFNVFLDEMGLDKYFTKLTRYVKTNQEEETVGFLKYIEQLTRGHTDDSEPLTRKEKLGILVTLMSLEASYVRFDVNDNNVLDFPELNSAFKLYKKIIMSASDIQDEEGYAKTVYFYMLKYSEIPGQIEVFYNHWKDWVLSFWKSNDAIVANRYRIATLLNSLSVRE